MLQGFRARKQSWLIYLIFGVIIVVFVFMFGLPSTDMGSKSEKDVARVGNNRISSGDLRFAILTHYDDNVFRSEQYPLIQRQVVDSLSTVYLMADKARSMGMRVSDDELRSYIMDWELGNPDVLRLGFLRKNVFNQKSYERALERYQTTVKRYEEYKQNELLARNLYDVMAASICVSDTELWQIYEQQNSMVGLDYIIIKPSDIERLFVPVTDEEARAFVASNADDIKKYYDENRSKYVEPEEIKLQQLIIQKDYAKLNTPGAKTNKTYQPKERASIVSRILIDEKGDFDQTFADYDESSNKESKGVGSFIALESLAEPLKNALEKTEIGGVVSVELNDTHVFAKVLERKERVEKPMADHELEIAKFLVNKNRVQQRTDEDTKNILSLVKSGSSMEDALANTLYRDVLDAPPLPSTEQAVAATNENLDETTRMVLEAATNAAIAEGLSPEDAAALAREVAGLPALAQAEANTAAPAPQQAGVALADRVKVQNLEASLATSYIPILGYFPDIVRALRTQAENSIVEQVFTMGDQKIIVFMKSKKGAERESFELIKADLRSRYLENKIDSLLGDFNDLISMRGVQGLWLEQLLFNAKTTGQLYYNEAAMSTQNAQTQG